MINLVHKYLDINQYTTQKVDFEDLFLSHPNYPSVFAITDSLDAISIENVAVKVPKEQWSELPEHFLAIYKEMMVLVSKKESLIRIETDNGKIESLTVNQFLPDWDGVIIAIEPNAKVDIKYKAANKKGVLYSLPFVALILLSVAFNDYSLNSVLLLATSLIGFVISVFIVQEKLGIKNEIAAKFCNINPNASCDAVIKSHEGNNQWMHFSDLPLLFFGVSTFSIILQPKDSSVIVGFLSLLSIPVIVYSIWVQKFEIKKWCVLCLSVSLVLLFQALIAGFSTSVLQSLTAINYAIFAFFLILLTSIWLFVKPVLENNVRSENESVKSKKFKRNFKLLRFLSKEIPSINGFSLLEGLHFGNNNASTQLSIIISPSCVHCHKAFEDAFELVSKFPERVFLKVLFNINPENNDNPYKTVVETLLNINYTTPDKTIEAITDWHIKKMKLEEWKAKWFIVVSDPKANYQMQLQYNWCLENEFNYTPVKIVNEKQFPNEYEINELKYFLNDFSEEKERISSQAAFQG